MMLVPRIACKPRKWRITLEKLTEVDKRRLAEVLHMPGLS